MFSKGHPQKSPFYVELVLVGRVAGEGEIGVESSVCYFLLFSYPRVKSIIPMRFLATSRRLPFFDKVHSGCLSQSPPPSP